MSKQATLLLIAILIVSSLIVIKAMPASAVASKPSVPEFTVKYVNNSYDVPPATTSSTNPYTGKTTTATVPGYHVENFIIEVAIKNQPFPSIIDGNAANLYYNVRTKGHFTGNWTVLYDDHYLYGSDPLRVSSSSEYTVLSFPAKYPPDGQVDFQVDALIGYYTEVWVSIGAPESPLAGSSATIFIGESSGWSKMQTITIPVSAASPSDSPQTLQLVVITGMVVAVFVGVGLLVFFKKRDRQEGQHG